MTNEGIAYVVLGICGIGLFLLILTIILLVEHKSKVEVGLKLGREERYVAKILKKTSLFWDTCRQTYVEVAKVDNSVYKISLNRYKFKAATDKVDLLSLENFSLYATEFYKDLKGMKPRYIPIYKDLLCYQEFVANQRRYLKMLPKYFWWANKIFVVTNRLVDPFCNGNLERLMHVVLVDGIDVLEGHKVRFIDPYCKEVEQKDGDKSIDYIKWIWNENTVNVYLLQKIYQAVSKPKSAKKQHLVEEKNA